MYDDDGDDDDNTSQRSPVPPPPPPRQEQSTTTLYGMIRQTQQSAAVTVTTPNPFKDADVGKVVSIMYEKNLFQTSRNHQSIAKIWMPELASRNDSNKQYYITVMTYLSFHIAPQEYEELQQQNLDRATVQRLAMKIDKRAKVNINKILDSTRAQTKLIGLGKKMREYCEKNSMTVAQVLQQKIANGEYFL